MKKGGKAVHKTRQNGGEAGVGAGLGGAWRKMKNWLEDLRDRPARLTQRGRKRGKQPSADSKQAKRRERPTRP